MIHCEYYINRNFDNGMLSVNTEKSVGLDCKIHNLLRKYKLEALLCKYYMYNIT